MVKHLLTKLNTGWYKTKNLDINKGRGQVYDGASSLRSENVGLGSRMTAVNPIRPYFHCMYIIGLTWPSEMLGSYRQLRFLFFKSYHFQRIMSKNVKKLNFVAAILDFWRPSWIDNGDFLTLYSIHSNDHLY